MNELCAHKTVRRSLSPAKIAQQTEEIYQKNPSNRNHSSWIENDTKRGRRQNPRWRLRCCWRWRKREQGGQRKGRRPAWSGNSLRPRCSSLCSPTTRTSLEMRPTTCPIVPSSPYRRTAESISGSSSQREPPNQQSHRVSPGLNNCMWSCSRRSATCPIPSCPSRALHCTAPSLPPLPRFPSSRRKLSILFVV